MADEAPSTTDQNGRPECTAVRAAGRLLKDASFEAPAGPRIARMQPNPTINLNLNTSVSDIGGDMKEVVLTVRVEAKAADKTVWLVECSRRARSAFATFPRRTCSAARHLLPNYCCRTRAK
jgi:preprotein translocase subunit SecB